MLKFRKDNMLLEIEQDINPDNPREWDHLGIMVCFHRRYKLGDDHEFKIEDFNGWDELEGQLFAKEDAQVVLPLYLYDHSGITMSTSRDYPFNSRWDAGQVGFIFAPKEATKHLSDHETEKILKSEVEEYDQYLRGEVFGYTLYELETCNLGFEHKKAVDSCWGFYGSDISSILENAGIKDIDDWEELT